MGIVLIGVFALIAAVLLYRASKLRRGRTVPLAFSSFLLAFQLFQVLSYVATHAYFFGPEEHFVLSAMILGATIHQFSNNRSMQYI